MDERVELSLIHHAYQHPFETVAVVASIAIAIWVLTGYLKRSIPWRRAHKRPVNWLVLVSLAAELIHYFRGC